MTEMYLEDVYKHWLIFSEQSYGLKNKSAEDILSVDFISYNKIKEPSFSLTGDEKWVAKIVFKDNSVLNLDLFDRNIVCCLNEFVANNNIKIIFPDEKESSRFSLFKKLRLRH